MRNSGVAVEWMGVAGRRRGSLRYSGEDELSGSGGRLKDWLGRAAGPIASVLARARKPRGHGISLRTKLIVCILTAGIASIIGLGVVVYRSGADAISSQVENRLTQIREIRGKQVQNQLDSLANAFGALSTDISVAAAISLLRDGWAELGYGREADTRRARLADYYRERVLPQVAGGGRTILTETDLLPRTDRGQDLQALFIAGNPAKAGEREALRDHPVSNPYTLAHGTYHAWFAELALRFALHDIVLVEPEDGVVVYSVEKEIDLGTKLIGGPHADSGLGRLVREVLRDPKRGEVRYSDFSFYLPSDNRPMMFIATPVFSQWKLIGVVAGKIPTSMLNDILSGQNRWSEEGLGESGEVYIVGADRLLRSESRFMIEQPERFLDQLAGFGVPAEEVEQIRARGTAVMLRRVGTEAADGAFGRRSETRVLRDYRGITVLSSYAPLPLRGLDWAIVAEIDEDEAFRPLKDFGRTVTITTSILGFILTMLAFWLSSWLLTPLWTLVTTVGRLEAGERGVEITRQSDDEVGRLAGAFSGLSQRIDGLNQQIDRKNEVYELMLGQLFPEGVARRLRRGEDYTVESAANATVVYLSLFGVQDTFGDHDGGPSFEMLNDLVEILDGLAEEAGIDKVKSTGEHYVGVCGLHVPRLDHARRAIGFAVRAQAAVEQYARSRERSIRVCVALASGVVHAGLIGRRRFVYDVWGQPCSDARRIAMGLAFDRIGLLESTYNLLGRPDVFEESSSELSPSLGTIVCHTAAIADISFLAGGAASGSGVRKAS
ncbi:MAG: HAMP domain-containing protein [Rhizobiales bacterium]|nr:HAMP domain-containing protein [Hyphomicrobiales bacterium]